MERSIERERRKEEVEQLERQAAAVRHVEPLVKSGSSAGDVADVQDLHPDMPADGRATREEYIASLGRSIQQMIDGDVQLAREWLEALRQGLAEEESEDDLDRNSRERLLSI